MSHAAILAARSQPVSPDLRLVSRGPTGTRRIGQQMGALLSAGDVLLLEGPLGAGKTCLTQGLAIGLGVDAATAVQSPSFTLVNQYSGRLPLYHADLYRLSHPQELFELGLWEAAETGGVVVIEWASRFPGEMPTDHLSVELLPGQGLYRQVIVRATGSRFAQRLAEIATKLAPRRRRS
ncbi:MAG TPA: tRNA (adenosine(37)-N6)-threonylcarbamoyltransferase complex ATPase subunit type 1 TsaE [Pseudomonadota bacterium]|nr:tRNA (adenosine(37)-N6)-threonylcarbamoyltransferase complex ATPase subunit type 1 TsaE [Pseudomonadota bacterium]